jgi:CheY-like chemotaxis protein
VNNVQHSEPQDAAGRKQVVLVVDARPMRQFYTSVFLQRLNYQVIMAKTAEDALLFSRLTLPLVIIANYDLPQMNGLELLVRVRSSQRTSCIPFIIYTSNRSPEVHQACEAAGCSAFLRHPCSLEELYATVEATQKRPRRFLRLATSLDVEIGDAHSPESARSALITALSERGMFVSTGAPLAFGQVLPFSFHLPNAPGWHIRIEGEVLHSDFGEHKRKIPGVAVKFRRIGDREQEFVRDFIKQELMEGIAPENHAAANAHVPGHGFPSRAFAPPPASPD